LSDDDTDKDDDNDEQQCSDDDNDQQRSRRQHYDACQCNSVTPSPSLIEVATLKRIKILRRCT